MLLNNNSSNLLQPNTTPPSPTATASSSSNLTTPHSYIRKPEFEFPATDIDNNELHNLTNCENIDYNLENVDSLNDIKINERDLNESNEIHSSDNYDYGDSNDAELNQSSAVFSAIL